MSALSGVLTATDCTWVGVLYLDSALTDFFSSSLVGHMAGVECLMSDARLLERAKMTSEYIHLPNVYYSPTFNFTFVY